MKPELSMIKPSPEKSGASNISSTPAHFKNQRIEMFRKRINILYVEDMLIHQAMGKKALETVGCRCDIANHGIEALSLLKHRSYDLILMDVEMPLLDGLQTTMHIRESLLLELPIIAFTTNTSQQDVRDCLNAGMNDHIAKPCTTEQLSKVVNKWYSEIYNKTAVIFQHQPGSLLKSAI